MERDLAFYVINNWSLGSTNLTAKRYLRRGGVNALAITATVWDWPTELCDRGSRTKEQSQRHIQSDNENDLESDLEG